MRWKNFWAPSMGVAAPCAEPDRRGARRVLLLGAGKGKLQGVAVAVQRGGGQPWATMSSLLELGAGPAMASDRESRERK